MEKVSVKDLVDFKRKSDRSKKTFAYKLKTRETKPRGDGGGNWWSTSLSAIGNTFKSGDTTILEGKIEDLQKRHNTSDNKLAKLQYIQNIDVLHSMLDYDFDQIRPNHEFTPVKSIYEQKIIEVYGLPVQAWPTSVFSFRENGTNQIGAIWFVTNKDPFNNAELGMFAEMLYRYLCERHSHNFNVSPDFCIALEPKRGFHVSFKMIEDGDVVSILDKTIIEIKSL